VAFAAFSLMAVGCSSATSVTSTSPEISASPNAPSDYQVVPHPARLTPQPGAFVLAEDVTIATSDPDDAQLQSLAEYATGMLKHHLGLRVEPSRRSAKDGQQNTITLILSDQPAATSPEAYRLQVTGAGVAISSGDYAGIFYGIQTLRQLLPSETEGGAWPIRAVDIEDEPRFTYRGMHLDVGRHFFPVEFVKKYIDLLAMYKMNTFHWHLTEDQGWRIEILKYPRLTEIGAYRKETIHERNFDPYVGDHKPYGGFYTHDEISEVVEYAAGRYITVIPEIEMPGHSSAALAAYPSWPAAKGRSR
jgi:hexosaminidase